MTLAVGNEPDHYLHFTPRNYSDIWGVSLSCACNSKEFSLDIVIDMGEKHLR